MGAAIHMGRFALEKAVGVPESDLDFELGELDSAHA
jgi:hypothetical protein